MSDSSSHTTPSSARAEPDSELLELDQATVTELERAFLNLESDNEGKSTPDDGGDAGASADEHEDTPNDGGVVGTSSDEQSEAGSPSDAVSCG